jgi:galactose oxidase-like protein/List-Bact-rpt repeat protein
MLLACRSRRALRTRPLCRRPSRTSLNLSTAVLCWLLLGLAACQEDPGAGPELAATKVDRNLTVTGGGTGGGIVSAPGYGETVAFECVITNGSTGPENCSKPYGWKTQVTLTATADQGSRFTGWSGACSGTGSTCKVVMTQSRSVKASFSGQVTPKYPLNVSGGGDGNGTVTSQSGSNPAINCVVSAGTAASGTCSASYDAGTPITLTATPSSAHTFDGWSGDCSGTGTCVLTMNAPHAVGATFDAPPGIEATAGKWDAPRSTPVIGLHLSQLFGGRVLMWGHAGEPQVWDPNGSGFIQQPDATCNQANCELFCSGQTFLSNGDLLVAGGHNEALGDNNGLTQASIFNGAGWTGTGSMKYPRWYPTLVTLGDGSVVALSGNQAPSLGANIPERYANGVWDPLANASRGLPLYPRAFVEPKSGRIFVAGSDETAYLDPSGEGSWSSAAPRVVADRDYGSAVMLDTKVLYIGGGGAGNSNNPCPGNVPTNSAEIIDLAAASPAWSLVAPMNFRRRQTNAVILPDGQVLVTGGSSQCGFTNEAGAVFAAEIWDPNGGTSGQGKWTVLGTASTVRVYHSTALLLADGRVLSTGSGDGGGATNQYNYEIFSPPYLFKGARPAYNLANGTLRYGSPFVVTTPDAAAIRKVTLIRLPATTHAFDMGERLNTLAFTPAADGQSLTVTPPAAGRLAPPGPYRLFIVNDKGVPSVGQTILLGP